MKRMRYFDRFADLCRALSGSGAFLVVEDERGRPNPMTIGWGTLGVVWGQPVMTVLVRPSRHTFGLLREAKHFSVNAPVGRLKKELLFCGTRSGRDMDKIAACGLKTAPGRVRGVTVLPDCDLVYECETVEKSPVLPAALAPAIASKYYRKDDYHTVYFGRVLHAFRR